MTRPRPKLPERLYMGGVPIKDEIAETRYLNDLATWEAEQKNGALQTFTAFDLQRIKFPPLQWVVPGYIVEGLTMIAGKPKIGKSWMVLDAALAVAYGGFALGNVRCDAGDVFYCALEDNKRRLQRRLKLLLPDSDWPDRLTLVTAMPRIGQGGIEAIKNWARGVERPRLVVVDTFKQIRPLSRGKEVAYDSDYDAIAPLQEIAGELGIAIVLVHHVSKREMGDDPLDLVSGTTGITGAVDTALIFYRDQQGTTLYGRGRDIEDIEVAVEFENINARWKILGDADDVRRSDSRKAIITALRETGSPMGPNDISAATTLPSTSVRFLLGKMVAAGEVKKAKRGKYEAP